MDYDFIDVENKLNELISKSHVIDDLNLKLNELDSKSNFIMSQVQNAKESIAGLTPQIARLLLQSPRSSYEEWSAVPRVKFESTSRVNLNNYKRDGRFSQGGEEGIVTQLYDYIEPTGFVIEFGAADGIFCSNTAHLWSQEKTKALLIESDPDCFSKLQENTKEYQNVEIEQGFVENIDDYTKKVADVISIDIDGDDYNVLSRMETNHQIVIVEYNPTVPPHVEMVPTRPLQGASAKSLVKLMDSKGYTLVACTRTNLFFLLGDHHSNFETRLEILFDYRSLNYVVTTYDGQYEMIGEWNFGFVNPENLGLIGTDKESCKSL